MHEHCYIRLDGIPYHIADLQRYTVRVIHSDYRAVILDANIQFSSVTVSKSNDFFFDFVHNNFFQFYGLTFPKKHTAISFILITAPIIANRFNRVNESEPIVNRLWTDTFMGFTKTGAL